ncbi:RmlC-like cupin domain-containing protein [Neohortaea acidophila]|uniref:RmlC-like cupin domain-containing protein n=1 Tax=Neohortaea acidophila TaxID=245834 RepID=A0A6A6PVA6_9PEZI|nr:RmlC-like cupin domain-containing protein [Neohortaea acidophila]KAF2483922.1 RmlC-like cupin domain-containing protein [Neohortaea acidophila]
MPEAKPVLHTPATTLGSSASGAQTDGMLRQNALVNVCDTICASRMIAKPHTASAIHHHADEDTVVFAFSGRGTIVSDGGKKKVTLEPGDYALIPAWAEHQEVNESDEDVVWCIVRNGKEPKVVNLEGGWGTS